MSEKIYPTSKEFLIDMPLYEAVEYDKANQYRGKELIEYDDPTDTYCPECNNHSIFNRKAQDGSCSDNDGWINRGIFAINLLCSRNYNHRLTFLFLAKNSTLQKIGQVPSLADLNLYDVEKYSKVLDKKFFQELTKSIGLASHGIGVGSFVYLRRIFEFLIEETHLIVKKIDGWDEEQYISFRMDEKIKCLKEELPSFLVENKSMYSILSKGIHELDEKECLEAYPIVKLGIELILDEKLEKKRKEKKLEEARKSISLLNQKHK